MQAGRASKTAELVCMGRAVAHAATPGTDFRDPTAFELLDAAERERVERARRPFVPWGLRNVHDWVQLHHLSFVMVARTHSIDRAIIERGAKQVVILGAGLDGRAYRMPELADSTVFEVDHPDTQRDKRARVGKLTQMARKVRFVPVDFEKDSLEAALDQAGHDVREPTTWVWEGVVMYLAIADIEAALRVVERRSAVTSRLVIVYHSPSILLRYVGFITRRLGEPLRSHLTEEEMRGLLEKHGFVVRRDEDMRTVGREMGAAAVAKVTDHVRHMRTVVAERSDSSK